MKKLFTLLSLSLSLSLTKADYWTQKANFPGTGVDSPFSFAIGTKGYVGTGASSLGGNLTNTFWEYDPVTNAWTQKANFGGSARHYSVGMSILNKGYAGSGRDNNGIQLSDFWEYDPIVNTWTPKADIPGSREGAVAFSYGSKGYVAVGFNSVFHSDLQEFDPVLNTWTQKTDFPSSPRCYATGLTIGNKCYLGLGFEGINVFSDFWEYDPVTDTWTQKASLNGGNRLDAGAFSICEKGYIGTGQLTTGAGTFTNDFWQYDPILNQWTQKTNFPGTPRDETAYFSIGAKGYLGLGTQNNSNFDFWEYSPDSACATGIEEEITNSNFQFSISPNPAKEFIIIRLPRIYRGSPSAEKENITITILNAEGKKVYETKLLTSDFRLPVSGFQKGIYFVEVSNGKDKAVKKFLKK